MMAKPWAEVATSSQFLELPPDQQAAAKKQYFRDVVAPKVPAEKRNAAWAQFDAYVPAKMETAPAAAPSVAVSALSPIPVDQAGERRPSPVIDFNPNAVRERAAELSDKSIAFPNTWNRGDAKLLQDQAKPALQRPVEADPIQAVRQTLGAVPELAKMRAAQAGLMFEDFGAGPARTLTAGDIDTAAGLSPEQKQAIETSRRASELKRDAVLKAVSDYQQAMPNTKPWSAAGIASTAAQSAPDTLAAVIGGTFGGPALAGAIMFASAAPDEYASRRMGGSDKTTALQSSVVAGAAESIGEALPLRYFVKQVHGLPKKAAGSLLSRLTNGAIEEGPGEMLTEAINIGYQTGVLHDDMTLPEAIDRVLYAGVTGAVTGGAIQGSIEVGRGGVQGYQRSAEALAARRLWKSIGASDAVSERIAQAAEDRAFRSGKPVSAVDAVDAVDDVADSELADLSPRYRQLRDLNVSEADAKELMKKDARKQAPAAATKPEQPAGYIGDIVPPEDQAAAAQLFGEGDQAAVPTGGIEVGSAPTEQIDLQGVQDAQPSVVAGGSREAGSDQPLRGGPDLAGTLPAGEREQAGSGIAAAPGAGMGQVEPVRNGEPEQPPALTEVEQRKLPENNRIRAATQITASPLYRETNPEGLSTLLEGQSRNFGPGMTTTLPAHTSRDLALGQGQNKGIMVELDPAGFDGRISTSKPTALADFERDGQAEVSLTPRAGENTGDHVLAFTLAPNWKEGQSKGYVNRILGKTQQLLENGWSKQDTPEGTRFSRSATPEAPPKSGVSAIQGKKIRPRKPLPAAKSTTELGERGRLSLLRTVKNSGGLNMADIADITGEKGRSAVRAAPGLFRKEGGRGIDYIAGVLHESGFISDDEFNGVDGGVERARELIQNAIRKQPIVSADYLDEYSALRQSERATGSDAVEAMAVEPAQINDLALEGLNPDDAADVLDYDLLDRVRQEDEAAFERAAIQYENDDTALMQWAQEWTHDRAKQGAEADRSGAQDARAPKAGVAAGQRIQRGEYGGQARSQNEEGFQLKPQEAPQERVAPSEDQTDLFGRDENAQGIADRQRAQDARRNGTQDVPAGVDGGLFSDQQKQRDIADAEPATNRKSFTVERINRNTNKMETLTFERGEYVRVHLNDQKSDHGEIGGISAARGQAKIGGVWHPFGAIYKAERPKESPPPGVPLSSVVDAANAKHGDGLTDADRVEAQKPAFEQIDAAIDNLRSGGITVAQYREAFKFATERADEVKAALSAKTKAELIDLAGGANAFNQFNSKKKGEIVSDLYDAMLRRFALGKSYGPTSYMMAPGALEKFEADKLAALKALVEGQTDESLAEYAAEIRKAREEAAGRSAEQLEALKNPKTLDDFRAVISAHMRDGKSEREARLELTADQRAEVDRLLAERSRAGRQQSKDEQRAVRVAGQNVDGQIIETTHTQKGHDLFVVQLSERVSREDYNTLNAGAKTLGGYYSSFRGSGAVPGFQFRDRPSAEAFVKLANGDAAQANEAAQARRDSFEDDRSQTAVERLTEMADRLEARADEALSVERKANTARRARMAASAEASASADKALATTMRNIAAAITEGRAKFLDRVRQKAQVEMLESAIRTAKGEELRTKYKDSYAEQEKRKGEPATSDTVEYAKFPMFTLYRSDLATLAREISEIDGLKKLSAQIGKVADDVTAEYTKFAKENFHKVAPYAFKDGSRATFPNRESAERAVKRSGLRGKAIVLPIKRGQNAVVMSPSEAIGRGIWKGDGDKRISLRQEVAEEIVGKLKGRRDVQAPWQFVTALERRKALARMGIETPAEYRSALREFITLREQAQEADRVKELERSMIGRANDGLDFFPTPAAVADAMIEAAELTPDMAVLEPSAGMGHIADRIRAAGAEPDVIEASGRRRELLGAKGYHHLEASDFLDLKPREFYTFGDIFEAPDGKRGILRGLGGMGSQRVRLDDESGTTLGYYDRSDLNGVEHRGTQSGYDRIIMNPPFSDGRDMKHVRHAYDLLRPGGRVVAIMGEGAFFRDNKQARDFREWLESVGGTSEKLADGAFMDPTLPVNTGVSARMVVVDRGAEVGSESRSTDFRRGRAAKLASTPQELTKALGERFGRVSIKKLTDSGILTIVQNYRDLPPHILTAVERAGPAAAPKALYFSGDGNNPAQAFVIADQVSPAEVGGIVLHEVGEHYGLRDMLGAKVYAKLLDDVRAAKDSDDVIREAWGRVSRNYGHLKPGSDRFVREVVAHVGERADAMQQGWFKRLIQQVRMALWKMGIVRGVSNEDIQALVVRSLRKVMDGAKVTAYDGDTSYALPEQNQRMPVDKNNLPEERPGYLRLYHGGTDPTDGWFSAVPSGGTFDGFFASAKKSAAWGAHGSGSDYFADIKEDRVLRNYDLNYELDAGTVRSALLRAMPYFNEQHEDLIWAAVVEDKNVFDMNEADVLEAFREPDLGEASWEAQRIRGRLAAELGYQAVEMSDEHGTSYLIVPGVELTRALSAEERNALLQGGAETAVTDPNDPRIDFSLPDKRSAESSRAEDVRQQALAKSGLQVGGSLRSRIESGLSEEWNSFKENVVDQFIEGTFDQFRPILDAEGNVDPTRSGYLAARMSTSSGTVSYAAMLYGSPQWQGNIIGHKAGTKGLLTILKPVQGRIDDFLGWMVGKRANWLASEEGGRRENNLTLEEIRSLIDAAGPDAELFEKVARDLRAFNNDLLELARDGGLLSQAQVDDFSKDRWYIPFYRVDPNDVDAATAPFSRRGMSHQTAGIKRLKGGKLALRDPLQNLLSNTHRLIDASMKNRALYRTLLNVPGLAHQSAEAQRGKTVRVMWKGRPYHFEISDPALLRALTAVGMEYQKGIAREIGRASRRLLTTGITAEPTFMIRNFSRDMLHAWMIDKNGFRLAIDSVKGGVDSMIALKKSMSDPENIDPLVRSMMFAGASFMGGQIHGADPGAAATSMRRALRKKGWDARKIDDYMKSLVKTPAELWAHYRELGDAVENANRLAVARAALAKGKSLEEAVFDAKDLMDFSLRGRWEFIQLLIDFLPFFNARLQGLYKLGRASQSGPKLMRTIATTMALRGAVIALASVALMAVNGDDDRYDELEDWDKDANWHIWTGSGENAKHIRIPKPFELGYFFGTLPERMYQLALSRDGTRDTMKSFGHFLMQTLAFNPIPQAVMPATEAFFNYDMFRMRPIENMGDQGKLPEDRYNRFTSPAMVAAGDVTGMSPKKLQHIYEGYTGTLGSHALSFVDWIIRGVRDDVTPERRISDYPVIGALVRSGPEWSSRYMTLLYEQSAESDEAYKSLRAAYADGNDERAQEIEKKHGKALDARRALAATRKSISAARKQMDDIYEDRTMSPADKRKELDRLQSEINQEAKEVVKWAEAAQ